MLCKKIFTKVKTSCCFFFYDKINKKVIGKMKDKK